MFIESLKSENCEDLIYLSGAHSVTHGGIQNCECDSGGEIDIGLQEWNNFSTRVWSCYDKDILVKARELNV